MPVEVPPVRENTTVSPPTVRLLLAASRKVRVRVTELPLATLPAETETREFTTEGEPGFTVTVGKVDVTLDPEMVAPIDVGVPAVTPVKVAV